MNSFRNIWRSILVFCYETWWCQIYQWTNKMQLNVVSFLFLYLTVVIVKLTCMLFWILNLIYRIGNQCSWRWSDDVATSFKYHRLSTGPAVPFKNHSFTLEKARFKGESCLNNRSKFRLRERLVRKPKEAKIYNNLSPVCLSLTFKWIFGCYLRFSFNQ